MTIGKPLARKEDTRLLTGQGRFSADVHIAGELHAAMVRSPHAHARIRRIATAPALAHRGVIAVFTGADCRADGLRPIDHTPMPGQPPGLEGVKPYLLTEQYEAWHGLLRTPTNWAPIGHSAWVCALYAVPALVAGYLVFLRRDVAGG